MSERNRPDAALCVAVAEELRVARSRLEALAGVLVADEHLATTYLEQFQSFDLIAQQIDESALVLHRLAEGKGPNEAIDHVRLTEVQMRLRAAVA